MPFYLWKAVIGQTLRLKVTVAEKDEILLAWNSIKEVSNIEEDWDCVVQNYLELEMELLKSAMQAMVLNRESYDQFQQTRLSFARRLSNLLHSCRSYLDHTPQHLNKIQEATFSASFKQLTCTAYDTHFGYRFMEALRNYSQHCGTPLHGTTFDHSWVGDFEPGKKDTGLMRHAVVATISTSKIQTDKKLAKILAELDGEAEHLDIAPLTREYIEALGEAHDGLRKLLKSHLTGWKATIRGALKRYADENNGDALGLTVAEFPDEDSPVISHVPIFDDLLIRLEAMMRRNGSLVNLRRRYVTNEIIPLKHTKLKKKQAS